MLIVFSGLPGSGKTTVARELAARLSAVYLRIDVIEQALVSAKVLAGEVGPAGYEVAYALAGANLALGLTVVADCVNPLPVTREAWRAVAASTASRLLEVEIVCSDAEEHRRRVAQREADIPGHMLPDWVSVLRHDYAPWTTDRLVIDTATLSVAEAAQCAMPKRIRSNSFKSVIAAHRVLFAVPARQEPVPRRRRRRPCGGSARRCIGGGVEGRSDEFEVSRSRVATQFDGRL